MFRTEFAQILKMFWAEFAQILIFFGFRQGIGWGNCLAFGCV